EFENLTPGVYSVHEVQPVGYIDGGEAAGSAGGLMIQDDVISLIPLDPGVDAVEYDFCELLPATISGYVYVDLNNDCAYDEGDPVLSGVLISLLDADGNTISVTLTDANGYYAFTGLKPGTYAVAEVQPAGYF